MIDTSYEAIHTGVRHIMQYNNNNHISTFLMYNMHIIIYNLVSFSVDLVIFGIHLQSCVHLNAALFAEFYKTFN